MPVLRHPVLTAVLAAAVAATSWAAPPAGAADPGWDVPDQATVTLEGDGFGHGVGMSQYGAYGAAKDGLGWKPIVRFYYPGTKLGEQAGTVRVLISADDDGDLVVDAVNGLRATGLRSGRSFRLQHARANRWRVRSVGKKSEIAYRTRGWHVWRTVKGDVELAAGARPLTVRTPDGQAAYRGALRSTRQARGHRITVNVVPMEAYVRGVVTSEMFASWPQQALRAQAVASRTYAAHERAARRSAAFDLCDTSACQVYRGVGGESAPGDRAVAGTAGRVLTWQGEAAFTQFSASDGGWTVARDGYPYLPAHADPYEGTSEDYYGWRVDLSSEEIEKELGLGNLTYLGIEARNGDGAGHVATVRIRTEGGFDRAVTVDKFFDHFNLRSTMFEITDVQAR